MKSSSLKFLLSAFLVWRIGILVFAFLGLRFVPLFSNNFLGGGFSNYITNPLFWGHLNFDGEHYLTVAQIGYQSLTYFYFPVFPLLVRFIGNLFGGGFFNLAIIGLVVSNVSFFIALVGIWKLTVKDFGEKIARLTVLIILFFPTSFYFGSYYTESLFLALVVWSFYLARKEKWFWAGILGGIVSATRVIGFILLPVFFVEIVEKKKYKYLFFLLFIPLGIFIYMWYLKVATHDPLNFLNTVSIFGAQRSSGFILLPQVFYRYFFKIIPSLTYSFFPVVFATYLELVVSVVFLILIIFSFWRLKISYCLYALFAYLIPTLAGSFSSMPRYVLVIFPVFILVAILIDKIPTFYKYLIFSVMILMLGVATAMFFRGYWVA